MPSDVNETSEAAKKAAARKADAAAAKKAADEEAARKAEADAAAADARPVLKELIHWRGRQWEIGERLPADAPAEMIARLRARGDID